MPQQQTFLLLVPNKIAASQKTIYRKKYLLTPSNRFCCLCCQTRPQPPQRLLIGKSDIPCASAMGFAAFAVKSASDTRIFCVPRVCRRTLGERSFQYIGPVIWNSLSFSIRHATSLSSFKSKLKTHLFSSAY